MVAVPLGPSDINRSINEVISRFAGACLCWSNGWKKGASSIRRNHSLKLGVSVAELGALSVAIETLVSIRAYVLSFVLS